MHAAFWLGWALGLSGGPQVSFVHNLNQLRQLLIFIIMMCYYKAYLGTKTTTTMQEQLHQQAFLEELDARQFDYCINRNRKLHLLRSSPADMAVRLPRSLIPTPILQLHQQYKQGTLDKELVGGPKVPRQDQTPAQVSFGRTAHSTLC